MIKAEVIADSISKAGRRLTTLQLVYPRFIHSEVMTHRVFSRNASSSRAIPVAKMIEQVRNNPAMPIHWGKNQAGMQAKEELTGPALDICKKYWEIAAKNAADTAAEMHELGLHKQVANRILEPFQHISVVLTATEFDNWFELRAHKDAQPEIYVLAKQMRLRMSRSCPTLLLSGEWHLPYVTDRDRLEVAALRQENPVELLRKISAARCCRVSYLKHDGHPSTIEEDLALCDRLVGARPLHASPFEHQATPDQQLQKPNGEFWWANGHLHGNLVGWIQSRKLIERQFWS